MSGMMWRWGFWFRIAGRGLWGASYATNRPLFSERNGYMRVLRVGPWRFRLLKAQAMSARFQS